MNDCYDARWFIHDYYVAAGRPKAEDATMRYAQEKYLYNLVSENALEDIQMDIERYCLKIRQENKRLAPVDIHYTADKRRRANGEDHMWLMIGQQHLSLRKVKNTIEY